MNINFILQTLIILSKDHTEDDLRMVYDYLLFLDYTILFSYYMNNTIKGYENDLYVYLEVVNKAIKVFEKLEEYEKCYKLKLKREESLKIINEVKK